MEKDTKLLVVFTLFILFLGIGFLWFGLRPKPLSETPSPTPAPTYEKPVLESTQSAVVGIEGQRALVTRVVDGDTFEIEGGLIVRVLGIDTPETVDPRRPVGCFGKEASNETKSLISGKTVILQKDVSDKDKYKRLLRYVYLPLPDDKLLFVDDYLVREGYAKVLTYPPDVKYTEQFLQAEREAREAKKGLWGRC